MSVQDEIDDLKAARASIATRLREMMANPKPSYSIDGQSVQHGALMSTLLQARAQIEADIRALEGPLVGYTQAYT